MKKLMFLSIIIIFSLTIAKTLLVPEEFMKIQTAIATAKNGDTVSVNFGRVNGKRLTVCSQQITGRVITFKVRGEVKEELLKMIADVNCSLNINNRNQLFAFSDSGWQGQRWVNRPDTNSSDIEPCIAIDSFGNPIVVWQGYGAGYTLAYSKWNGIDWDIERGVGPNAAGVLARLRPSIVFNNQNKSYLVWHNVYGNNNRDIACSRWIDTCWNHEMQVNLPDSTEQDFAPKINCGGGQIWCVWYGGTTSITPNKIYASRWNGINWEPDMQISPSDGNDHWWCSIAVDNNGRPHVVWCESPHHLIYYSYYNGISWANPIMINDTLVVRASSWADPRIAIDYNGNLHVSWTGALRGATHRDIFYNKYNGVQWSPGVKISQDSIYDEWYSDITVYDPNNIWITWDRQGEGQDQFRVYASHYDGSIWSNEIRLDNDLSRNDYGASINMTHDNTTWVVFSGIPLNHSNYDIFYNKHIRTSVIEESYNNTFALFSSKGILSIPTFPLSGISYRVVNADNVTLKLYNIYGQHLSTLVDEYKTNGEYFLHPCTKDKNGNKLPPGIYIYMLHIGNEKITKKIILLK